MNIILLKNKNDAYPLTAQQKQILKYAHQNRLTIDSTEIENSHPLLVLEDRKEFKGFLRSLKDEDHVLIFDLTTFSSSVEELVKIFECILARSISLHVVSSATVINIHSKPLVLLELLVKQRELNKQQDKEISQGRPKGRMSTSKFDIFRPQVIELLEEGISVSEISKRLEVSRTSLKDYINSRGLKDLVKAKEKLLNINEKKAIPSKIRVLKECSLIAPSHTNDKGIAHDA